MVGPNDEVEVEQGSYWGSMHVLPDGEVKYNKAAKKSLKIAGRFALVYTDSS